MDNNFLRQFGEAILMSEPYNNDMRLWELYENFCKDRGEKPTTAGFDKWKELNYV